MTETRRRRDGVAGRTERARAGWGRQRLDPAETRDHVKLDRLLRELGATDPARQDRVLRRIYRLVFPHAFAEESVLWPAVRRELPDGEALTLRIEREHQEVNDLVTALDQMPPSAPDRPQTLARLVTVLNEDVRDEEDLLLPRLQEAVDPARLRRLGVAWEVVRRVAPTRAHPIVSRRPPGNVLAAIPLAVLDRIRDGVDFVRQHEPARGGPLLTAASRRLARVAQRTERLRLLRRGEEAVRSSPSRRWRASSRCLCTRRIARPSTRWRAPWTLSGAT